jgi:hypothetical protein
MNDILIWSLLGCIALAAVAMVVFGGLKGWQGWLELKRLELGGRHPGSAAERIELADLKERIRKLESIASCVDL